ncbi:MAG: heat-shock protein Hsp20 [Sedimenticola sp.]|nr:MAG: heat-shock protein Hsp20 [Sedimenticola sp.]
MSLVRTSPLDTMKQLQREMDRLFKSPITLDDTSNVVGGDWVPAVDIKEEDDKFVVHADIPGVAPSDIEVSTENGMLTIKGERKHESKEEKDNYKRIERSYGSFYRRFSLPDNTDQDKISATGNNGVLEITIPKVEVRKPHKIAVKS